MNSNFNLRDLKAKPSSDPKDDFAEINTTHKQDAANINSSHQVNSGIENFQSNEWN